MPFGKLINSAEDVIFQRGDILSWRHMKTIFWALSAGPALLGIAANANAATVVPGARWNAYVCAGTSQICNPQLGFPANTQASYDQPDGTAYVIASYGLTPPSLAAEGRATGDANARAFLNFQYFIELTGQSGTVPLTVIASGFTQGNGEASVVIQNNTTLFQPYSASTGGGLVSVIDNGSYLVNSSGSSFGRSDVVNITEGVVYEVAVEVQIIINSNFPYGNASVDPYFEFPDGYTLAISSGVHNTPFSATPLPAALPLFATGLGATGLLGWRRKRKAAALAA